MVSSFILLILSTLTPSEPSKSPFSALFNALSSLVSVFSVFLSTTESSFITSVVYSSEFPFDKIFELATKVLSKLPPEVSAEIRHSGMYITGGSAGIVGLDTYCKQKFNMNINIASDPNVSTVLGTGTVLGNTELLKKIKITDI